MPLNQIIVQINPDVPPTGSDLGIVNAARRSFGKRSESLTQNDINLLKFLARGMTTNDYEAFVRKAALESDERDMAEMLWHWRNTPTHDTPINHGFFSFEVKAPIFVARQLVKHEYLIMSEFSRRYITDDVEFYEHVYRQASKDKKQGSGATHPDSEDWSKSAREHNLSSLALYNRMIANGVAPEQARGQLPADLMTAWTWSGTFGAFAKMCQLRLGSDAQAETRYVAEMVYAHLRNRFPFAAPMFVKGV